MLRLQQTVEKQRDQIREGQKEQQARLEEIDAVRKEKAE